MQNSEELTEEFYKKYAGKYRLTKFVVGENDCSEAYVKGWKDKSFYMFFEITEDGKFSMTAHTPMGEKEYEYSFDPVEMKYYQKADHSDAGIPVTIENGVLTEKTADHLMVCVRESF